MIVKTQQRRVQEACSGPASHLLAMCFTIALHAFLVCTPLENGLTLDLLALAVNDFGR
jgi:hypothetical protein